jgi:uncharacterized membrane protein HdeD (DUF308 family)
MAQQTPSGIVRSASTLSILWGVSLIILGMLAVGSPLIAAVAVHLTVAFHTREAGSLIWRLLVGLAYVFFGVYLLARPALGVVSLTLVLATLFLVEGVLNIVLFFRIRSLQGSSWVLIDGIITLLLGLMIYTQWPSSSAWAIGTLVGVSMIISGVTRVMLSLSVRKAADTISSKLAA